MSLWMDETMEDRLPAYANHYVGVGAVVVNENEEILLTQEKRWSVGNFNNTWKIPGGHIHQGETIKEGVERELF